MRDDDVDAAAEGVLLRSHADAAEDRGAGDRRVHRQIVEVGENLRRELACRRQHQRASYAAALGRSACARIGRQERRRLAAAGHRARERRRGRPAPAGSRRSESASAA